jgi:hypothetical protein
LDGEYLDLLLGVYHQLLISLETNVLFIAYSFEEGKSPNTISTYLEALSYYLKFKGRPDITNNFIIKKLVNGDMTRNFGSTVVG